LPKACKPEISTGRQQPFFNSSGGYVMEAKHESMSKLPAPYEEVFIWCYPSSTSGLQRRVARLHASKEYFQLSTYLETTKGQYVVTLKNVERWAPIVEGNAHDDLVKALEQIAALYEERPNATTADLAGLMYDSRCIARAALAKATGTA
jgi:hypothetical protein